MAIVLFQEVRTTFPELTKTTFVLSYIGMTSRHFVINLQLRVSSLVNSSLRFALKWKKKKSKTDEEQHLSLN